LAREGSIVSLACAIYDFDDVMLPRGATLRVNPGDVDFIDARLKEFFAK
jgi:hypothetical protein